MSLRFPVAVTVDSPSVLRDPFSSHSKFIERAFWSDNLDLDEVSGSSSRSSLTSEGASALSSSSKPSAMIKSSETLAGVISLVFLVRLLGESILMSDPSMASA